MRLKLSHLSFLLLTLLVSGCVSSPKPELNLPAAHPEKGINFLVVGDTGYSVKYLKKDQYEEVYPTQEVFLDNELEEWKEDFRDPDNFQVPPYEYVEKVGGYLASSGLYPVAKAMDNYCQSNDCQFGIVTGDNIYPNGATLGSDGVDDATRFDDLFTRPFGKLGAETPNFLLYTTLGNHDWYTSREGAMAQLEYMENNKPFYMDGLFYRVKPPAGNGDLELFVIDTEVMLSGDTVLEDELNPDGSEKLRTDVDPPIEWAVPINEAERNMVQWLDEALRTSTAKWKIVVGHHPIWSSGGTKFEQARTMRKLILPSLCKYADVYIVGHEHTLEVHEDSCEGVPGAEPLPQIVSGAGAKQRPVHTKFAYHQKNKYPQLNTIWTLGMVWGFAHLSLAGDSGEARMIVTPNNGDASTKEVFTYTFNHRSK